MEITRTEQVTDGIDSITWTLSIEGEEVGSLIAHTSGLILNIGIDAAHQGEGCARALFEHADADYGLVHVPEWGRTSEGHGFARAMGGDTMDDQMAADILGLDLDVVTGADCAG